VNMIDAMTWVGISALRKVGMIVRSVSTHHC
jgi:hypothetical protein